MSDHFVSARKLLIRGRSGPLRILTVGDGGAGWYLAAVRCPSENTKFVGKGESLLAAVENAIKAYNAGAELPRDVDEMIAKIVAQKEDDKPRIISPY